MAELSVRIEGLEELQRKCTPELYEPSVTRILTKTAIYGENKGKERAPVDKGPLRASVAHQLDSGSPPQWARYGTNLPYGRYLNSPVTRKPHYRRGPRQGQTTAGWLTDTLPEVAEYANGQIKAEVARIEAQWSS